MRRIFLFLTGIIVPVLLQAQTAYTLGIGHYPGRPSENFEPRLTNKTRSENLSLHRSVLASSTYDKNLCAHLLTDGIVSEKEPAWFELKANGKAIDGVEREFSIDGGPYTNTLVNGSDVSLVYSWHGGSLTASRFHLDGSVTGGRKGDKGYTITLETSTDGRHWTKAIVRKGQGRPAGSEQSSDPNKQDEKERLFTRRFAEDFRLSGLNKFSHLRLKLNLPDGDHWRLNELKAFRGDEEVQLLSSQFFSSAWMSRLGTKDDTLTVDLGVKSIVTGTHINWIAGATRFELEASLDGKQWRQFYYDGGLKSGEQILRTDEVDARYVRMILHKPLDGRRFALSEWGMLGMGGANFEPHPRALGGSLAGGDWRLQRASEVKATGEQISLPGFEPKEWLIATVPGTVLTSFINLGAVPDPNVGSNVEQISESYFHSDFWYRTTFRAPRGKQTWLCFDGINWKAEVYVNGQRVGNIAGAFRRARFDVTDKLREGDNVVAVLIHCNDHFGGPKEKTSEFTQYNGGILGADNPTFHASIGWDWITTVRGRNMGIWNDVYLETEQGIHLSDPYVQTTLSEDTLATIVPHVFVKNTTGKAITGTLRGFVANVEFSQRITLQAGEEREVVFSPEGFAQLRKLRLPLWWPNGYGSPVLHKAGFSFEQNGETIESLNYKAGLREIKYKDLDKRVQMFVNGRRFIPLGGNWGFDEHNLRYRSREYDIAVKMHRNMNFTMIRNWVGQVGDEAFYEACDKYGIMVWQDFWLANPSDGPDPYDEKLFMDNARDYLRRMRGHASMGIYVGRNEGDPTKTLDRDLRLAISQLAPGMDYIPNSADDGVSGHGPYSVQPVKEYFKRQSGKLHSERGMPNVPNIESLRRMLSPEKLWPVGDEWGKHDFTLSGAQCGRTFISLMNSHFDEAKSAEDFTRKAQLVNYNGYRAMYEANNVRRQGLLIWMSHSCWPSMTWDTYDYYFDTPAGYFAAKKACEPLHIQWDELNDSIQVVNLRAGDQEKLSAAVAIYDEKGKELAVDARQVSIAEDRTLNVMRMPQAESPSGVRIIRLTLINPRGEMVSENTYIKGKDDNLRPLMAQGKATLQLSTSRQNFADSEGLQVKVKNVSDVPALMVRLVLKGKDGEQILPAFYSDNFLTLLPGEERTVGINYAAEDSRGQQPEVEAYAINQ